MMVGITDGGDGESSEGNDVGIGESDRGSILMMLAKK